MNQQDMLANIRIELQDSADSLYQDDEIIRAVSKAVSLMSRMIPKRGIVESTLVRSISSETLTIASSTGTLAYHPVKKGTLAITGKVLDTDYRINYLTGVVTEIGANLPDTTYTATYELDPTLLDVSTFLTDYIKIERVEYPAGDTPPTVLTFDSYGTILSFRGNVSLDDNNHIRVIYLSKWTPPTTTASGDYPSNLDDAVIIGAVGEALIFKAEYYTQKASANVQDVIALLGTVSSVTPGLATLTPPVAPTLTFPNAPTGYTIVNPTAPSMPVAPTAPTAYTLSFTTVDTAFTDVAAQLDTGIISAENYLTAGDDFINAPTRGDQVGANYANYANTKISMAQTRINEGIARMKEQEDAVALYSENITSYGSDVNAYANNISGLTAIYREQNNTEMLGVNNAGNNASVYSAQVNAQGALVNKYQAEVASFQAGVASNQNLVSIYSAQIGTIVNQATQLATQSTQYLDIAGRYLASGQAKINEMLAMLGQKPEFAISRASTEQRS